MAVAVTVDVTVGEFVCVGVGVLKGVTVGVGVKTLKLLAVTHEKASINLIIKLLSASGEGTINEYGNILVDVTKTQLALKESQ